MDKAPRAPSRARPGPSGADPRFFVEEGTAFAEGGRVPLPEEEARHAADSLRLPDGAPVVACRADGLYASAVLRWESRKRGALELAAVAREPEPRPRFVLCAAIPKGRRWTWLVEKTAELGVDELVPLRAERSVALGGGDPEGWRRWAREACKQCGRARVPRIAAPRRLADVLAPPAGGRAVRWLATPGAASPWAPANAEAFRRAEEVHALVGPEGGFSPAEADAAAAAGWRPVGLADAVLRVETAAVALAAAVAFLRIDRA